MLKAYRKNKALKALEAQLPQHVAQVKNTLKNILKDEPSNTLVLFTLVRCHLIDDELIEAKHTLESLLEHDPGHGPAKVQLAKILFKENDTRNAISLLTEVTTVAPENTENWQLLSECLLHDQQEAASKKALDQYHMIKAFNDTLGLAEQAFANAEFVKADKLCRQLLQRVPTEARALRLLARIAKQFQHYEINTNILARCVEASPGDPVLGVDYAYSLLAGKMFQEALEQCNRLIEFTPENIDIYDVKAGALVALGQYDEAIDIYRKLLEEHEKRELCFIRLGEVLKTVGETREAIACFRQAIEIEPLSGEAYWNLASLKTYQFSTDEIASMQRLIKSNEILAMDKVLIQFALGRALEDSQKFKESFECFQSANNGYKLIRPVHYSNRNTQLKSFFTTEYFSEKSEYGHVSDAPIFIVGLPRSGSTLVEQILSSHSQVDATMELTEVVSIARELNSPNSSGIGQYPQSMASLGENQVRDYAQRYLDFARAMRQQAPYFVDKAHGNFHHIGLIKTLLPNARIIDVRRNPMASGWSIYKHFFAQGYPFSYDLLSIGEYYKDYMDLMSHWHTVLPGQILTVNYEDLINDLPTTVDTLLAYCGLVFEEACLDFHLNERAVATPSSEQVRQPIYTDAIDHWKNYETYLAPLKNAIEK